MLEMIPLIIRLPRRQKAASRPRSVLHCQSLALTRPRHVLCVCPILDPRVIRSDDCQWLSLGSPVAQGPSNFAGQVDPGSFLGLVSSIRDKDGNLKDEMWCIGQACIFVLTGMFVRLPAATGTLVWRCSCLLPALATQLPHFQPMRPPLTLWPSPPITSRPTRRWRPGSVMHMHKQNLFTCAATTMAWLLNLPLPIAAGAQGD